MDAAWTPLCGHHELAACNQHDCHTATAGCSLRVEKFSWPLQDDHEQTETKMLITTNKISTSKTNPSEVRNVKECDTACSCRHISRRTAGSRSSEQSESRTMIPRHVSKLRSFKWISLARRTPNRDRQHADSSSPTSNMKTSHYTSCLVNSR